MNEFWKKMVRPEIWLSKLLLAVFVVGFLLLGMLNITQPIRDFLDSEALSLYFGDVRLSVYLLIRSAITIFLLLWVSDIVSDFGETRIKKMRSIKSGNRILISKTLRIVVYFVAFIIALDVIGIDLTALTIFSGAVGIGLGFGLQKITSNFISGLILLFEQSLETDDLIQLSDGTFGFIRNISARYTLIETYNGREVLVPNEDLITSAITNWTYSDNAARVDIAVGIGYESDIEKAMQIMLDAAKEHPRCAEDPAPACYMREFADSSINLLLSFWVRDVVEGTWGAQSDVMRTIWKQFQANDISIPYPQLDVQLKENSASQTSHNPSA